MRKKIQDLPFLKHHFTVNKKWLHWKTFASNNSRSLPLLTIYNYVNVILLNDFPYSPVRFNLEYKSWKSIYPYDTHYWHFSNTLHSKRGPGYTLEKKSRVENNKTPVIVVGPSPLYIIMWLPLLLHKWYKWNDKTKRKGGGNKTVSTHTLV